MLIPKVPCYKVFRKKIPKPRENAQAKEFHSILKIPLWLILSYKHNMNILNTKWGGRGQD